MLKVSITWEAIRSWWVRWNAYRRAYSNRVDWPIILFLRKPLFSRTAVEACKYLARGKILDVGTGCGRLPCILAEMAPNIAVIGIDVEPILLRDARKEALRLKVYNRISFLLADVHALPFADESVDMVISMMSLHLWRERRKGILELHRVLKNYGVATIQVSRRLIYPGKLGIFDFFTGSSTRYVSSLFKDVGFKDIHVKYQGDDLLQATGRKYT
jgi:ubiquinone/menaquinone biosynthesis C-methylase UbiE